MFIGRRCCLQDREAILRLHTAAMPLHDDVDQSHLATKAHGYSGADLAALCREAGMRALMAASEAPLRGSGTPPHPSAGAQGVCLSTGALTRAGVSTACSETGGCRSACG